MLLGSHAMHVLLERLRESFDHVVIDAPPVLPVSDAAVLAHAADGALLVVRYGRTRREQLLSATRALEAVQARVLGTVLTAIPARRRKEVRGHDEDYHSVAPPKPAAGRTLVRRVVPSRSVPDDDREREAAS